MSYFRKLSIRNSQIENTERGERFSETKMACNELDINILRERIQLLEIENDKLKKENEILKKKSRASINPKDNKSLASSNSFNKLIPLFHNKTRGCTCKGNCANKICGCMKKNLQCNEACKCNTKLCKNKLQEKNKENYAVCHSPLIQKESQKNINITGSAAKNRHPTESISSVDDVFYDASEPELEDQSINVDAVKKLTFQTDDDTPEKDAIRLSMIQELEENEEKLNNRKKSASDNKKVLKDHKKASTSQVEKEDGEGSKLNKAKKQIDSNNDDGNSKKQRKGSKSKRTASVEEEEYQFDNRKINSRSRRNKGSVRNEEEILDIHEGEKVKSKSEKEIAEHINLESIKSTGVTSCIKSVSNLKQPKDWNKSGSCLSLQQLEETDEKEISRNTRSKKNNGNALKNIITKATRVIRDSSSQEIPMEAVQSRVGGLRRSLSIGSIGHETEQTTQRRRGLQKSKSVSRENFVPGTRTLSRSLSNDNLSKKPLKTLISKVSQSFRKSKAGNNQEDESQIEDTLKVGLTPVKESPTCLNSSEIPKQTTETCLKFDPMQPTRQLSRSPIPAVSVAQRLESSITSSPPIFSRFLNSHDISVDSPPPEILEDLNAEEVDPDEFQSKLVICRKCKRKFFPHRIKLHESVCHKN